MTQSSCTLAVHKNWQNVLHSLNTERAFLSQATSFIHALLWYPQSSLLNRAELPSIHRPALQKALHEIICEVLNKKKKAHPIHANLSPVKVFPFRLSSSTLTKTWAHIYNYLVDIDVAWCVMFDIWGWRTLCGFLDRSRYCAKTDHDTSSPSDDECDEQRCEPD